MILHCEIVIFQPAAFEKTLQAIRNTLNPWWGNPLSLQKKTLIESHEICSFLVFR